ncbi:translocase [Poseidonocella sedimentorum]|uniref:Preprotein translocase subunit SecA n=1 Tax=Poseidonocella sedimentorum TaxID=871652 RepID=A0A1I6EDP7_9RHOB|nr:translocase [Poseidonocella sedimentorum]SFR15863.1 preprotein translocase subunit SecA [Poseidonocella sedimentorum]
MSGAAQTVLAGLKARYSGSEEGSLWGGGPLTLTDPSRHLRLLAPHQHQERPRLLDRWGATGLAVLRRFANPMRRYDRVARRTLARAKRLEALNETDLATEMLRARARLRSSFDPARTRLGAAEIEALVHLVEAVRRTHGFRPHPEQLIGVQALLEGAIAEMATGEGKTLTAAIAAVVAAWRGRPCHVVTSNDYLAARDAEISGKLFTQCRVSAASVTTETPPDARAAGYGHDIVYTTAQSILADHLRDGLALTGATHPVQVALRAARAGGRAEAGGTVQRGLGQVIVDEADSVLIDEAITPLIISAEKPDPILEGAAETSVALARALQDGRDYRVDHTLRSLDITSVGRKRLMAEARKLGPFWQREDRAEELVRMALYAEHLLLEGQHFVIEEGKVVLVDELTGRLARQRTLSLGMQQVLEARLGLEISPPSEVRARLSFQRYFGRVPRLGGMTGTAREARDEFARAYGLAVVRVPTHRPSRRKTQSLRAYARVAGKNAAIVRDALALADRGRAVLIGLRSVEASAALAEDFAAKAPGREVAVLNAVFDSEEAAIVAQAGQSGRITIATNMAGRGTDIAIDDTVRETGGLHVIIAEVNDFARIDRQLVGRGARQGDPGTVRVYTAQDDELFRRFLPPGLAAFWRGMHRLPPAQSLAARAMIRYAQGRAERLARKQRRGALDAELELEKGTI